MGIKAFIRLDPTYGLFIKEKIDSYPTLSQIDYIKLFLGKTDEIIEIEVDNFTIVYSFLRHIKETIFFKILSDLYLVTKPYKIKEISKSLDVPFFRKYYGNRLSLFLKVIPKYTFSFKQFFNEICEFDYLNKYFSIDNTGGLLLINSISIDDFIQLLDTLSSHYDIKSIEYVQFIIRNIDLKFMLKKIYFEKPKNIYGYESKYYWNLIGFGYSDDNDIINIAKKRFKYYSLKRDLEELNLSFNNLSFIPALDYFKNLKILKISSNNIKKIQHLDNLIHLEVLELNDNKINEIQGLENLKNLKVLNLGNNNIRTISGLEHLVNLETLKLSSNNISEIKGLDTLVNLEVLELDDNSISRIRGFKNLQKLKHLGLKCNNVSQIEGLVNLQNLAELDLSSNNISKIESLENLQNLLELDLSSNNINDIEGLENLRNLRELDLSSNNINEIDNLNRNLRYLNLGNNRIERIQNLEKLNNIMNLDIQNNLIQKIEGLDKFFDLRYLDLSKNRITKITSIDKMKYLQRLDLSYNKISKIEGLDHFIKLLELNISCNSISEISNLKNLKYLEILNLEKNQIDEINRLNYLSSLKKFYIYGNNITKDLLEKLGGLNYINREAKSPQNFINYSIEQSSCHLVIEHKLNENTLIKREGSTIYVIKNSLIVKECNTYEELVDFLKKNFEPEYFIKYLDFLEYSNFIVGIKKEFLESKKVREGLRYILTYGYSSIYAEDFGNINMKYFFENIYYFESIKGEIFTLDMEFGLDQEEANEYIESHGEKHIDYLQRVYWKPVKLIEGKKYDLNFFEKQESIKEAMSLLRDKVSNLLSKKG